MRSRKERRAAERALQRRSDKFAAEIRRDLHEARTNCMGGEEAAEKARAEAARLREEHGLCLHADDARVYSSDEESNRDESPPVICGICSKPRLCMSITPNNPLPVYSDPVERFAMDAIIKDYLR